MGKLDPIESLCFMILILHTVSSNPANASSKQKKSPKIVNGVKAPKGLYPFIVGVADSTKDLFCGASIYDRDHVITAAHCIEDELAENLKLFFGDWSLYQTEPGEQTRGVKEIIIHQKYKNNNLENDMAILVLEEPLIFTGSIRPICLTHKPTVTGEEAFALGWGETYGTADNNFLQVAMVPIIDREQCNHFEWLNDTIVNGMICAGYEEVVKIHAKVIQEVPWSEKPTMGSS